MLIDGVDVFIKESGGSNLNLISIHHATSSVSTSGMDSGSDRRIRYKDCQKNEEGGAASGASRGIVLIQGNPSCIVGMG